MTNLRKQISESASQIPQLGKGIFWSFSEMILDHSRFLGLLTKSGITDHTLADKSTKKSAVIRATDSIIADLRKAGLKDKRRHTVVDDEDMYVSIIVHEERDRANQDIKFDTETKITMHKKLDGKPVHVQGSESMKELFHAKVALYENSYTTDQIQAFVLAYMFKACSGSRIRENGGLYFIPTTMLAEFHKLQNLFMMLHEYGNCSLDSFPVVDDAEARACYWKAITGDIQNKINNFKEDLEELRKSPSTRAIDTRLEKYSELRTFAEMHEVLFKSTARTLIEQVDSLETELRSRMVEAAKANKKK
jgi:hypothetical protein